MPFPFAAAGLALSAFSAASSAFGARQQNQTSIGMSREQMAFQERMSSTAYQRSMADMRAAGLNPMLAYGQGGATTPSGAQPTIVNPMGTEMGGVASTALQARRLHTEIQVMNSQQQKNEQETALGRANTRIAGENLQSAKANAAMDVASEAFYKTDLGQRVRQAEIINRAIPGFGALRLGAHLVKGSVKTGKAAVKRVKPPKGTGSKSKYTDPSKYTGAGSYKSTAPTTRFKKMRRKKRNPTTFERGTYRQKVFPNQ